MNSLITVGIVTHNRFELLTKCLKSVYDQDFKFAEVLVLDDCSSDDTSRIEILFPDVVYEKEVERTGQIAGRNKLMKRCKTPFFLNLDDDAQLISQIDFFGLLDYLLVNVRVAILNLDVLSPLNWNTLFKKSKPHKAATFLGCGNLMRISHVEMVGYYHVQYYGGEEEDLSIKLMDNDLDIINFPGVYVWHEITSVARDQNFNWSSQVKNALNFIIRFYPWYLILPLIFYKAIILGNFSIRHKRVTAFCVGLKLFLSEVFRKKYRNPVKISTIYHFHHLIRKV